MFQCLDRANPTPGPRKLLSSGLCGEFVIPYRKLVTAILLDAVEERKKTLLDMASQRCGCYPMMSTEHDCGQIPGRRRPDPGAGRPTDKCIRSRTWTSASGCEWKRLIPAPPIPVAPAAPTQIGVLGTKQTNRGRRYRNHYSEAQLKPRSLSPLNVYRELLTCLWKISETCLQHAISCHPHQPIPHIRRACCFESLFTRQAVCRGLHPSSRAYRAVAQQQGTSFFRAKPLMATSRIHLLSTFWRAIQRRPLSCKAARLPIVAEPSRPMRN